MLISIFEPQKKDTKEKAGALTTNDLSFVIDSQNPANKTIPKKIHAQALKETAIQAVDGVQLKIATKLSILKKKGSNRKSVLRRTNDCEKQVCISLNS
jgi:hypothetical protein